MAKKPGVTAKKPAPAKRRAKAPAKELEFDEEAIATVIRAVLPEFERDQEARAELGGYLNMDEAAQDRESAIKFLRGIEDFDDHGLPFIRQPTQEEERPARVALSRLLASKVPLDSDLRNHLARYFHSPVRQWFNENHRYIEIARLVWVEMRSGSSKTAAVQSVADEYMISERTVWTAITRFEFMTKHWERFSDG
jgi:hypothetical protein